MKKLLFTLLCFGICVPVIYAELPTYLRAYSLDQDGSDEICNTTEYSIPIYQEPDTNAVVVDQLNVAVLGWAPAKLLWRAYSWAKIQQADVMGYVQCNKIALQTWYYGEGPWVIVTESDNTPIYHIYTEGEFEVNWESDSQVVDYVAKGTILADCSTRNPFDSYGYFVLSSCLGDVYFIKQSDVKLIHRTQVPN